MALTQKRAQQRCTCLKPESISYRFHLILQPGTTYRGLSQLAFTLDHIPSQLPLDCKAKQLHSIIINSQPSKTSKHEDGFLYLDCSALKKGVNTVAVSYTNKYDNDGNGCVSFIDVDGKQYIYTQFEPYHANRVFVLFDQPDLKATMELSVVSPMDWGRVLSNEDAVLDEEFSVEKCQGKVATSHQELLLGFYGKQKGRFSVFPPTKLLPSYLFCFVAGPYKQLALPAAETYKKIPMSLYCIQSLYSYLSEMAPFIFQITIECMKFFQKFFGVDYPFNKYDQVFAHEYKCGAMENAGIVTFNDLYIWKEKVSTESMLDLANTISHELSHHWFGNLSTMKWWDDLWLNESFAEFISHFCLQKIRDGLKTIKYESSMSAFLARKAWGYHEDQLVTTHPIAGEVANTVVAESIFDGITYSKGAATMKQLLLLMGEDNFSKGLTAYFKKYAFKNATLSQFIAELQNYFDFKGLTLQEWKKVWLETASLNQLEVKWNPENKSEKQILEILQTPFAPEYPTLRPHKIQIALFKQDSTFDVIETLINPQPKTLVPYDGSKGYKALLLNYDDHSFVKVVLDTHSLNFFSSGNLTKIDHTLTRTMIWRSFFDMVKDGIISSLRYIDVFEANIANEKSDSIFQRHFDYVHTAINTYTPIKYRDELNTRLFYFILNLIPTVKKEEENRLVILKSQLCNYTHTEIATRILLAWRARKYSPLAHHRMTLVQKWKAVTSAFTLKGLTSEQKIALLKDQLAFDQSDQAKLEQAQCQSLISTPEQFEAIYNSFKDPKNEKSIALKRAEVSGWNHCYHHQRLQAYKKRYFEQVVEVSKNLEGQHFELFLEDLLPNDDNLEETIAGLKGIKLPEDEKFDKNRRDILKSIGDLERRLKAYHRFEQFSPL